MRAQQQDHYAILGVAPDASPAHITHAYRNLLRRHHPDTRPPASDVPGEDHDLALQRILTAYAVLHDSQQRAVYDQHRLRQSVRPIVVSRADDESIQTTRPVRRPPTPPIQAGPVRWHYRVEQPNLVSITPPGSLLCARRAIARSRPTPEARGSALGAVGLHPQTLLSASGSGAGGCKPCSAHTVRIRLAPAAVATSVW
jgi:curved DNA-binding protein CbpA